MFKNPLKKYQQGGQVSQEQQQMLAAFVEWLPKRVKEFQGMKPEQIVEALNGMAKSPEGQKQVQAYMQQFQQEMQAPQTGMFKEGGKLQDFVCKHAKGGHVAGCGCKEEGGKVNETQKKQRGGFLPGDVNNTMVQDITRRNPDGSISRIKIIASPNGDAARQTITGRDTTSVGGYWNDNKFIPDGDIVYDNNELENGIKALQQRPYYLGGARKASLDNGRNYLNQNRNVNSYRELESGGVVKGQEGVPGIRTATGYMAPRTRNINGIDMQLASINKLGNALLYTNGADSSFVAHKPSGDHIFSRSSDGTFSGFSTRESDLEGGPIFDSEGNLDPSTAEVMFNKYRDLENGTTITRRNPARWTQVQTQMDRNGGVVKGQGGLAGLLQNLGNRFKNRSRARLYDHDLNKSVVIDLPEDLVSTAYGWPGHDGVYNESGKIISAGALSDVLARKGSDYTRTDYYDPILNSINPYFYTRKIRTIGNAPDDLLYYGNPIKRDTVITKSLLGIGPDKVVEHGSDEYNQVNAALDDNDSSKVYHRKLGKTYKLNK